MTNLTVIRFEDIKTSECISKGKSRDFKPYKQYLLQKYSK